MLSSLLNILTVAELKTALDRFLVKYTRNQNNKADLLILVSTALTEREMDVQEFVNEFRY